VFFKEKSLHSVVFLGRERAQIDQHLEERDAVAGIMVTLLWENGAAIKSEVL
jgi:hypothetical protein